MLVADADTRTHDGTHRMAGTLPAVGTLVAGRYQLTKYAFEKLVVDELQKLAAAFR